MSRLLQPNIGLWLWLGASIAIFAILTVWVAVLWIRDRRAPKMALGWLGAWVLLHIAPPFGLIVLLVVLYRSMRGFVARHSPQS